MTILQNQVNTREIERSYKPVLVRSCLSKWTQPILFIIFAFALNMTDAICAEKSQETNSTIHAVYAVGDRLRSKEQIVKTDFDVFDFVYLMAGPTWEAEDFAGTEADAMKQVVAKRAYTHGDKGRSLVPMFIKRAHAAGTRVLLSLPGHKKFRLVSEDPKKRRMFADVMAAFVKKHDYDGIEIDWEGADLQLDLHAELMKDLRSALDALQAEDRRYTLTAAMNIYLNIPESVAKDWCKTLDWINLMCYDLGGGNWGSVATHNTPLPVIKERTLRLYEKVGVPRNKLCIGLGNYGFIYRDLKPGEKTSTKLDTKGNFFSHTQLAGLIAAGWSERYDEEAQVPYYFSPDGKDFVTIDNQRSLTEKVNWVKQSGYRGVFWWELHCDLLQAGKKDRFNKHPLIDHVTKQLDRTPSQ